MKIKNIIKFVFGFVISILFISLIYSYHIADDILPGKFYGNYSFKGNLNLDDAIINGGTVNGVSKITPGTIVIFPSNQIPINWSKCNGSVFLITEYPELYEKIGNTFGGDGITTFAIPDLRGEFVRGFDDGRGVDSGRIFGSFQNHQIQDHGHSISHSVHQKTNVYTGAEYNKERKLFNAATVTIGNPNSGNYGAETRPRNIALNYIIKIK